MQAAGLTELPIGWHNVPLWGDGGVEFADNFLLLVRPRRTSLTYNQLPFAVCVSAQRRGKHWPSCDVSCQTRHPTGKRKMLRD